MPKRLVKRPKAKRSMKRIEFTDASAMRVIKQVTRENEEALKILAEM